MSDEYFDPEDYEGLQERQVGIPRSQVRKWEKAAKERDEALAELAVLKRTQAFAEAGIPTEGAGQWFRKGYDGDLNPESIRAAFGDAGIGQANAASDTAASLAGHAQARDMAAGASSANPSGTAAELAAMRAQARAGRAARPVSQEQRDRLQELMAKEGSELDLSKWQMPSQLGQT
jgi:hypothetical protein